MTLIMIINKKTKKKYPNPNNVVLEVSSSCEDVIEHMLSSSSSSHLSATNNTLLRRFPTPSISSSASSFPTYPISHHSPSDPPIRTQINPHCTSSKPLLFTLNSLANLSEFPADHNIHTLLPSTQL